MGEAVCLRNGVLRYCDTAGVGVLNDRHAGTLVIPSGAPSGIAIGVVVVAHLLAVQLGGARQPLMLGVVEIQCRALVRVLAIAQSFLQGIAGAAPCGEGVFGIVLLVQLLAHPGGNGHIIGGGMPERLGGELGALGPAKAAIGECLGNGVVMLL